MRALHRYRRLAGQATLYLVVAALAAIILTPVFFLCSLSLMSDSEAYNEWPLPLLPSLSSRFSLKAADNGYVVSLYNRSSGSFLPLAESADVEYLASFIRRKTNCNVPPETLLKEMGGLEEGDTSYFSGRKSLLANYVTFFKVTRDALPSLYRSVRTALATVMISLLIGGTAGYAFARHAFKGKDLLRWSVLFVRIFPGVAVAIPMVVILARLGLYDRPFGLALVYAVGQIALTVWITAGIFMSIPVELEEAARVFGSTRTGAFLRITLPLALPGLAACALYAFIGSWNETIQALVLTQANPTFPVVVYQTLVGSKGMVNLATAGGVSMALPAVVFTLIIRKYILRMWGGVRV